MGEQEEWRVISEFPLYKVREYTFELAEEGA